jgi:NDP-sugar pyrophosphorylase family protein
VYQTFYLINRVIDNVKALILAAGEGTRLRPLTFMRQKPMTPVGSEPAIFYLVSHLSKEGFDDIVVIVGGALKQHIMDYLGDGSKFGVHITYVVKPDEFHCGTAGCLKLVDGLLDDTFLIAQADTLTEIPLSDALDFHRSQEAVATIVLTRVEDPSSFGVAVLDDKSEIIEFQEKPEPEKAKSDLVSTGFYILEPECLQYMTNEKWDFAHDFFPHLLKIHKKMSGFVSDAFWVDIGRLDGYLRGFAWALQAMARQTPQNFVVTDPSRPVIIENGARIGPRAKIMGPALIESGANIEDDTTVEDGVLSSETRLS